VQGLAQSAEDRILSQVKEIVSAQNLALGICGEKRLDCKHIGIANQMGKAGKLQRKTLGFFLIIPFLLCQENERGLSLHFSISFHLA